MGTTALIGAKYKDGKIRYAFVGYEGYPGYTGELLKERYGTFKLADELIALWDFRMLHPTIEKTEAEIYKDARYWPAVNDVRAFIKEGKTIDYLYLSIDGEWKVKSYRDKDFRDF